MGKFLKLRKLTSCFLTLVLVASLFCPSFAAAEDSSMKTFDIIEITDFHGNLEDSKGLPVASVLASDIKSVKAANPDRTLIIGGGDLYQGTPTSNVLRGVPVQKVLSNMGMEVTAIGNHEFDWSIDTLKNVTMKDAKFSIACANLYDKKTKQRVFDPYKIITKDGVRIAVIGAITEETPNIVLGAYVENYYFTDITEELNAVAKELRDTKKADVIIGLVHEGGFSDQGKNSGPIFEIASGLKGVDALFGGHTHSIVNSTVNNMPVFIANSAGKGYINVKMTIDSNGKPSFAGNYTAIDTDKPDGYKAAAPVLDSEVKAIVDDAKVQIGPLFNEKIGVADKTLTRQQDAVPYGESFLGNWVTDAMRAKADADVALQNNGGIRIDIPKGNITVGTMYYIMPFDNTICTLEMKKSELKSLLEQAFNDADTEKKISQGKGIQLSGIKVIYDSSRPSFGRIVDITRENGDKISDTEILKIATNDFLASGGDGFTDFTKYKYINTNILVRDVLLENVKAKSGISTKMNNRIENATKTITILGTSDIHGNIYPMDYSTGNASDRGLAKVAAYVKNVRYSNQNVLLVDNGDTIQGTPLSYYYDKIDTTSVYPMMKVMGAMKYDSWTLGNHEFNYGLDTLNRIIKDAKTEGISVLSANTYKNDGSNFVKPYIIKSFTINGKTIKVGVLGLTTKTIPSWENESNYAGLHFNDLVDEAKKWVSVVKAEGADLIIASIHSGEEKPSDLIPENQIKAIATSVSGIDAIIAGHSHTQIDKNLYKNPDGKDVVIVEPKPYGAMVSQIDINIDANGKVKDINSKNIIMDKTIIPDSDIVALAQPYQDKTLEYVNTVLGQSTGEYTGKDQTSKPTALMDLVNEVQMKSADTQLSIAAPFSSSAYIPQGNVTIKDISSVYIYENFLYGIKMTGAQIKKWLEFSARYYKQVSDSSEAPSKDTVLNIPDYNLDILYGATYDIDVSQPTGNRIKNLKYNDNPINDEDVFTVAINNYRFNGGGGFMAAAGLKPGDNSIVTYDSSKALGDDGQVRNLMFSYIQGKKVIEPVTKNNWSIKAQSESQPAQAVETTESVYIVLPGDCLSVIAEKYGISYLDIAKLNNIQNVNLIFIGQKLIIPAK